MAAKAQIIDFLLAGYRSSATDIPLAGGTVTVTLAGTATTAYVWDDRDKTLPTVTGRSTVNLDEYGRAEVYGDGIYKFVINDALGSEVETIDYFELASIGTAISTATSATPETGKVALWEGMPYVDVRLYGIGLSLTNGTDDWTLAITNAMAVGPMVVFPVGTFLFSSKLTIPAGVILQGQGREKTNLSHEFNGDAIDMLAGAEIRDINIEGNGATYTGAGITFPAGVGKQKIKSAKIINFDDECIAFGDENAGSQCVVDDVEMYRISAGTGTDRFAVVIPSTQQLAAKPRTFTKIQTSGSCSFNFGGSNNTYVSDSTLGDVKYEAESRAVLISNSRILNQAALNIDGNGNSITGCDIAPQITIVSGADAIQLQGNTYNILPIIDNSGNNRNTIDHYDVAFVPTFSSSGADASLGDGTLTGAYTRNGSTISFDISLTAGSTTAFGTGYLKFDLPQATIRSAIQACGTSIITIGATTYTALAQIPGITTFLRLQRDTSGLVTAASPAALSAGDTIKISGTYLI